MPGETRPAAVWIMNKITGDLQDAKMWPVKLANVKHQEALGKLALKPYHSEHFWNSNYTPYFRMEFSWTLPTRHSLPR